MASLLYRLGHFAVRRRRLVLLTWLLIFGATTLGAVLLSGPTNGSFSIPGAESHQAITLLSERFPDANGASGRWCSPLLRDRPSKASVRRPSKRPCTAPAPCRVCGR